MNKHITYNKPINLVKMDEPGQNFRDISVYPTINDLQIEEPDLHPNIIKGPYRNVEHYLDVNFKLLREDFIAPLRNGIQSYKEPLHYKHKVTFNNVHVYSDVAFVKGKFVLDNYGYLINFNKQNQLKINWEMSKRFMYGSLLLFSRDNFKTIIIGIVLKRKIDLLKQGMFVVKLLEDEKPLFNTSFTMIESPVFFEPYKCSMEVLKNINIHNFPMEKYIISTCNKMSYPSYIESLPKICYSIDELKEFQVTSNDNWPTKQQLGLDELQYEAFRAALSQEFTVIQGPPGTGKTFIGLKVMRTILNNLYNKPILKNPILVVCYTNHALDQFIEGVLSFTNKVVRIGGQSKSAIIEKYSLKNVSRMHRRSVTNYIDLKIMGNQIKATVKDMEYFRECTEVISNNVGVLEISLLKTGMPEQYHLFFQTNLDLLSWLFLTPFNTCLEHLKINEPNNLELEKNTNVIYSITLDDIINASKLLSFNSNEPEAKIKLQFIMLLMQDYLKLKLEANIEIEPPPTDKRNLSRLTIRQRWFLYSCWLRRTKEMLDLKLMQYGEKYAQLHMQCSVLKDLENVKLLKTMHVVAMTTTGAAKHRNILEKLESPIVVVEEAAEVLEAHIISSLTSHCQHLILIGDHKQLRPSNAAYKLAKNFNFDISLFERMINNDVPCSKLGVQYRMRPEIASLISPSIYDDLRNHISVNNREHIRGITKDVFFINHTVHEKDVNEISSKSNDHEAEFLIKFARHLILQGYKTDQVTILTFYTGQLFLLRSLQKQHPNLKGLKITVVDNYQGEECDIILLSLVRSNENGNVGFLKTDNRICVALSRAKYGLYIMGNMENMYKSNNLWKQIKESLVNQNSYGDELTLECAIHFGTMTKVSKSDDFKNIIEGGCSMLCKSLMSCGHYCSSKCHPYDREHLEMKCREPCNRYCVNNHACSRKCFMDCEKCTIPVLKKLPCGHQLTLPCSTDIVSFLCEEMVESTIEKCGHTLLKKCHDHKPSCLYKCGARLDCGHVCMQKCHQNNDPNHEKYKCIKPCEEYNKNCKSNHKCVKMCYEDCGFCTIKVEKTLPCGHVHSSVACGLNDNEIKCENICNRTLKCGHKCKKKCYKPCKGCEHQVQKAIPDCSHLITVKCKTTPERKHCTAKCNRILACGHKCKSICGKNCSEKPCKEIVIQRRGKLACGHKDVRVLCCDIDKEFSMSSQYLLDKCSEPCLQVLSCNDICSGTCGECKQGRLHVPCNAICFKINPCNHMCKAPCKQRCPPCEQKCLFSCIHSYCTKKCGNPCAMCKESCEWNCKHFKCTKLCGEICNRKPCYVPCTLKLECGHECIGFCGEPCPPLCSICQRDEVTTILFGYEDEPDARFVYLEDCGHSIESIGLTKWMNQNNKEICLKNCPLCKTPILTTKRFMNQVKVTLIDINRIKRLQFENQNSICSKSKTTVKSLNVLTANFVSYYIGDKEYGFHKIKRLWDKFCVPLLQSIRNAQKKNPNVLSDNAIQSLNFVIELFKTISTFKDRVRRIFNEKFKVTVIDHFDWLLSVAFQYAQNLTNDQKLNIHVEMARGARILSLFEIMTDVKYQMTIKSKTSDTIKMEEIVGNMETLLMSCNTYTLRLDEKIQTNIDKIQKEIDGLPDLVTKEERQMINEAMSTSFATGNAAQGHWCKCPNNHIYCITECGGPMEQASCPECKCMIGGENHRHVSGITVATEMDGARNLMFQTVQL